jgi:hypothetical protein
MEAAGAYIMTGRRFMLVTRACPSIMSTSYPNLVETATNVIFAYPLHILIVSQLLILSTILIVTISAQFIITHPTTVYIKIFIPKDYVLQIFVFAVVAAFMLLRTAPYVMAKHIITSISTVDLIHAAGFMIDCIHFFSQVYITVATLPSF